MKVRMLIVTVACGTCNFITSARSDDSAKAAMVDHLVHSHTPEKVAAA